ncbi:MAG TPA: hypothetical protein VID74_08330 [Gemmatimonadales bacterium]|jgi:hypothetical protein
MRMIHVVALATVAAIGGCSSNTSGDNNNSNNTACTVTFTGGISATSSCTVGATYGLVSAGNSDFGISNTGTTPGIGLSISFSGRLASGTFTQSSSGVTLAVTTASNGGLLWSQTTQNPARGSLSVTLSSVSLGSDGFTYTVHGTADATLTTGSPTPTASDTVKAHVVF